MTKNLQMSASKKKLKLQRKKDGTCIQCGIQPPFHEPGRKAYIRCRGCLDYQHKIRDNRRALDVSYARKYRVEKKRMVFAAYDNKCNCCGEVNSEFLTVDHMNNDGAIHRREIGSGSYSLYLWLIHNQYPSGFQLLCGNCHLSKNRSGICIHQIGKSEEIVRE